jgi:hypothetical protein
MRGLRAGSVQLLATSSSGEPAVPQKIDHTDVEALLVAPIDASGSPSKQPR